MCMMRYLQVCAIHRPPTVRPSGVLIDLVDLLVASRLMGIQRAK